MKFRCLRCSQKIAVDELCIGVVIACPTCNEQLIVRPEGDAEFLELAPVTVLPPQPVEPPRSWMARAVEALLFQRRQFIETQDAVAEQLAVMEQRLALLQTKWQRRLAYYEERVETLEAEKKELLRHNRQLAQLARPVPLGTPPRQRVRLSDRVLLSA